MKALELNKINKLTFSIEDIASALSVTKDSAKVSANRYVKSNFLIRLKNNLYMLSNKINSLTESELFKIANIIQVPSYVSFTSALSYYSVTSQQLQGIIESAALKRTKEVNTQIVTFNYLILKKEFYNNFVFTNEFFIATPEKALADIIYLSSMNRYQCDFEAIDFKKIDKETVTKLLTITNTKSINYWNKLCKRYKI
jgi:predicted transcriptional regulator of viral defense system